MPPEQRCAPYHDRSHPVWACRTGPSAGRAHLTRRAKAAIVVQFILNEGADVPLSELPGRGAGSADTGSSGAMRLRRPRHARRRRRGIRRRARGGRTVLSGQTWPARSTGSKGGSARIPRVACARRRECDSAAIRGTGSADQSVDRLIEFVTSESIEIAAVHAVEDQCHQGRAGCLGGFPGPQARRITYAVSKTPRITPEAVDRIGLALACRSTRPLPAPSPARRRSGSARSSTTRLPHPRGRARGAGTRQMRPSPKRCARRSSPSPTSPSASRLRTFPASAATSTTRR